MGVCVSMSLCVCLSVCVSVYVCGGVVGRETERQKEWEMFENIEVI